MDLAHVVLPAAAFGEQTGTVLNVENRVLPLAQCFTPVGESRSDWEIIAQIMAAQGIPYPQNMAAIQSEMKDRIPELCELPGHEELNR
jgi:predicted molibdopterin-dependent oxidoreductase YjgC